MVTAKHFKNVGLNLGWRCIQDLLTGATPGCNQQLHPLKRNSATPQLSGTCVPHRCKRTPRGQARGRLKKSALLPSPRRSARKPVPRAWTLWLAEDRLSSNHGHATGLCFVCCAISPNALGFKDAPHGAGSRGFPHQCSTRCRPQRSSTCAGPGGNSSYTCPPHGDLRRRPEKLLAAVLLRTSKRFSPRPCTKGRNEVNEGVQCPC